MAYDIETTGNVVEEVSKLFVTGKKRLAISVLPKHPVYPSMPSMAKIEKNLSIYDKIYFTCFCFTLVNRKLSNIGIHFLRNRWLAEVCVKKVPESIP